MKIILFVFMMAVNVVIATAGERFVTTLGTVQKEITADKAAMTIQIAAKGKTIEESTAKLEILMKELAAQIAELQYPTSALSLKFRAVQTAKKWDETQKKWTPSGFEASASYGVILVGLTRYSDLLTYLGTHEGSQIVWRAMSSSAEGEARRHAIPEALRAARAKAMLLAQEGGTSLGKIIEVAEEEVGTREYGGATWSGNSSDPNEGTGAYPIGIYVRVRAKFELGEK